MSTTTSSRRHRESNYSFDLCGQRVSTSTGNDDGVGSLSFSTQMQQRQSATTTPYVVQVTRLSAVPSTSCRALTFNEVPVRHALTEEELVAAEAIQGLKMGGFSPFTSPFKDLSGSPTTLLQHNFAAPSQTASTPSMANGEASTGGDNTQNTIKTFSTGSGDDSVLSATDLETAAYVSIPRPIAQARRKLNLDGLCSPTYASPASFPFKSIVSEKHSPDNDLSNDGTDSRGPGSEFKTPKAKSRRRISSNMSVGSSPLLSPSPRTGEKSPNSSRFDSSLYLLTSKFIELMNSHDQGLINLNEAAAVLDVPKRRIYDITNVLEGIGLVEKSSKNCCKWGEEANKIVQEEEDSSRDEMHRLIEEERHLDGLINALQGHLAATTNDRENAGIAYIRYEDLRNTKEFTDKTVIAVKAPADTLLEVPDPEETGTFQMTIRSQTGQPVEVFLCPERVGSSKPPSTGYYASAEFLEQANESKANTKQKQESASHLETRTSGLFSKHEANNQQGLLPASKTNSILPSSYDSGVFTTTKTLSSVVESGSTTNLLSPQLAALDSHLLSPASSNGPLPFLSLDPPPEPDDYLFALEPYEGATELFDIYVAGNSSANTGNVYK